MVGICCGDIWGWVEFYLIKEELKSVWLVGIWDGEIWDWDELTWILSNKWQLDWFDGVVVVCSVVVWQCDSVMAWQCDGVSDTNLRDDGEARPNVVQPQCSVGNVVSVWQCDSMTPTWWMMVKHALVLCQCNSVTVWHQPEGWWRSMTWHHATPV